jgi:hypothetical protein
VKIALICFHKNIGRYPKEWIDLYKDSILNQTNMDFDILEIAESLDPDHYTPIICEGFGFLAIGKKEDGSIILAFRPKSGNMEDEIIWKSYNEVINGKS